MENTTEKWYKLRGVEYSTDFNFFIREQIFTHKLKLGVLAFSSRLEAFRFETISFSDRTQFTEEAAELTEKAKEKMIKEKCREIHQKLLAGEYGQGELVD